MIGIYAIRQRSTGIAYIGRSVDIDRRWKKHRSDLNCGRHHAPWLQRAWCKHGADDFMFEVVEQVALVGDLQEREHWWLSQFSTTFNDQRPSDKPGVMQHSDAARARMSSAQKARKTTLSKEHLALMQQRRRETCGWISSPETRAKMSTSAKLKPPPSAETRERLRQANYRRTYGSMSQEQKDKLRIAHAGKVLSEAHKAAISAAVKLWRSRRIGDQS